MLSLIYYFICPVYSDSIYYVYTMYLFTYETTSYNDKCTIIEQCHVKSEIQIQIWLSVMNCVGMTMVSSFKPVSQVWVRYIRPTFKIKSYSHNCDPWAHDPIGQHQSIGQRTEVNSCGSLTWSMM